MKAKILFPPTFLMVFACTTLLRAQYVIKQWNVEHGLPQSSPRCITQTHDGYLWVGTWNGLARFDGVRMTVFNALNTPNFHPSVITIHEDRNRRLWIGTDGGGLMEYRNGALVRVDSAEGIWSPVVNSIAEDTMRNVWFGTNEGVFVHTNAGFRHLPAPDVFPKDVGVAHVLSAPDGSVYLQFVEKIFRVRLSGDSLVFFGKSFPSGGYRIAVDSSGAVWYGKRGKGLVKRVGSVEYVDRRFADVHPKETFILPNQQKWIMTPHGAYVLTGNEVTHFQMVDGIDLSNITSVFQDREGILWVAVEGQGLLRLRRKQVQTFTKRDGLETNEIMCGMEDRSGNLWIGTWLGGLSWRKANSTGKFIPVSSLANGLTVMALDQSLDGKIWVGTWADGVHTIDAGQVKRFRGKGLQDNTTIRTIVSDPRGGVWIASIYGMIGYYNGREEKVWDADEGIPGMINSMLLTREGDVWVGTDGGGIVILSKGTVSILNSAKGLFDDFAHVSIEDRDGAIWLTSKRGLQRWKNGALSPAGQRFGYDHDHAQFIQDDNGDYWSGGTHGIHRILRKELNEATEGKVQGLSVLTIGKADGMPGEECSGGSNEMTWKTRDGALWFSTTQGAVRIYPSKVASNPVPPGVMIDQVLVDNRSIQWEEEIVLNPQQTKIEFHYTGINFAAPERIRFQYRMEGFDDDWRDVSFERLAQYTNLDPGRYTFRVKAANNAGLWNEAGTSVAVVVLPWFWQTWWFRGFVVLFFLTVGPSIYWYRVRQLKKEKERQVEFSRRLMQSQEEERQRIANELHDSLGQNLLVLKNKLLLAQQSKEAENGMGEMSDLVSQTIEEVRNISHNLRPHQLDQLGVSKTIRALVRQIADSTPITLAADIDDVDDLLGGNEDIALFRVVQECLSNIVKHSGATEVSVNLKRFDGGLVLTIRDNGKRAGAASPQAGGKFKEGFGVSGMRERAKILGGTFDVTSAANGGTIVDLRLENKRKRQKF